MEFAVTKQVNVPTEEEVIRWANGLYTILVEEEGHITPGPSSPELYLKGLIRERMKSVLWATNVWPR